MIAAFIGHRKINETPDFYDRLKAVISELIISNNIDTCLFGNKGEFDNICWQCVTEIQSNASYPKRIYVRAEYPYIDDNYKKYLISFYEDTFFPQKIINSGRACYIERNYFIIDQADICIFYYDYAYSRFFNIKKNCSLFNTYGGTAKAYSYAIRKNKYIVNLFDVLNSR